MICRKKRSIMSNRHNRLPLTIFIMLVIICWHSVQWGALFNAVWEWYVENLEFITNAGSDGPVEKNFARLPANNSKLVKYIRSLVIEPYSNSSYNLDKPELVDFSQHHQTAVIQNLLKNQTGGFFIECGAFDGEQDSNTLYLERELGWTGLLIEANPESFKKLLTKHRKAYAINSCLSLEATSLVVNFTGYKSWGGLGQLWSEYKNDVIQKLASVHYYEVFCVPLYTILLSINITQIDYFSLDIEGAEVQVLNHIPFNKLNIKLLGVEWSTYEGNYVDFTRDEKSLAAIRSFFKSLGGYREVSLGKSDVFFMKD